MTSKLSKTLFIVWLLSVFPLYGAELNPIISRKTLNGVEFVSFIDFSKTGPFSQPPHEDSAISLDCRDAAAAAHAFLVQHKLESLVELQWIRLISQRVNGHLHWYWQTCYRLKHGPDDRMDMMTIQITLSGCVMATAQNLATDK